MRQSNRANPQLAKKVARQKYKERQIDQFVKRKKKENRILEDEKKRDEMEARNPLLKLMRMADE